MNHDRRTRREWSEEQRFSGGLVAGAPTVGGRAQSSECVGGRRRVNIIGSGKWGGPRWLLIRIVHVAIGGFCTIHLAADDGLDFVHVVVGRKSVDRLCLII